MRSFITNRPLDEYYRNRFICSEVQPPMSAPGPAIKVDCEKRTELFRVYAKAIEEYFAAAMRELDLYRGVVPRHDYEQFRKAAEQARNFADQAKRALQRHLVEHQCDPRLF
jgi:hypothetical protein